jgi:hypothetical protein
LALSPITESNISTQWSTNFSAVILTTSEPCVTYYTIDGSDPTTSLTRRLYVDPFIIKDEGITIVKYYSISINSSLANTVQTELLKIDSIPPITVMIPSISPDGENGWYITLPTISLTSFDSVSNVKNIFYAWNGQSFLEYSSSFTVPGEGIHYLQVYAIDNANNKEAVQTFIFKIDVDAPTTAIKVPLTVSRTKTQIVFVPSDKSSGHSKTYYTIDGTTPTINSKNGLSFEIKDTGVYTVKYFSIDNAGNIEPVKESIPFRVEIESSSLEILLTESFPINGNNGWYRSSPLIGLMNSKPHLITKIQYKIAPSNKPTTAVYTSTINITNEIDLSNGSFIALEIDQSGQPVVINIRGTNVAKTTLQDIIQKINNTYGEDIAKETNSNGLTGTGYITITSPTAGIGLSTSEVKFVSPGSNDATEVVFGLDIDNYPHIFTENYLYEDYTTPFLLPGDGLWKVDAKAIIEQDEIAELTKEYSIDSTDPVTVISINPEPNDRGYYTSSPNIILSSEDNVSEIYKIIYQFDEDPMLVYHPEDGAIQLPNWSKIIRLTYFAVDKAGNVESPHYAYFDYDFTAPVTVIDTNSINNDPSNITDLLVSPARIVEYNVVTQQYEFNLLTETLRKRLLTFNNWNDAKNYVDSISRDITPIPFIVDLLNNNLVVSNHSLQNGDVIKVDTNDLLPHPFMNNRYYYVIVISSSILKLADTYENTITNNPITINAIGSGNNVILPQTPDIISFSPISFYLKAEDDREFTIENEEVLKDETKKEITIVNKYLKSVIQVRNITQSVTLNVNYFTKDKIYTVESFLDTDEIVVDYTYTTINKVYYTTNGIQPTDQSSEGIKIDLINSNFYTLKWFSEDNAGNIESIKTFAANILIVNRSPLINTKIVKSSNINEEFNPNGDNGWYKLDVNDESLRPAIEVKFSSPDVYVFNEDSNYIGHTGSGPYTVQLRVLKVNTTYESLTNVIRIRNVTKNENYSLVSFLQADIVASASILPDINDIFEIDYTLATLQSTVPSSKIIKIGDPENPDEIVDFSSAVHSYYKIPYDIQGEKEITVFIRDRLNLSSINNVIPQLGNGNILKLDTFAPITNDNVSPGWVSTDVNVILQSRDYDILPNGQEPSNVARIFYSTDGTFPNTISVIGSSAQIRISNTGQYIVRYRAIDFAGNNEEVKQSTIIQIDKQAPTTFISVIPPDGNNGWYRSSPSIVLVANDLHSGVLKTYYKWNNESFDEYTGSLLIPSQGIHTLYFYSIDNVNNIEEVKSFIFKLDSAPPVSNDNIVDDWTNDNIIVITLSDNASGSYRTYFTLALEGDLLPDPDFTSPYTENGRIFVSTSGIYNLKYFSVDFAGNIEDVKTALHLLHLDLTRPQVSSVSPADMIFTNETHLIVNFTDSFSGIDVNSVRILVDDIEYSTNKNSSLFSYSGNLQSFQVAVGPISIIPNFEQLEDFVVYASDLAGNTLEPVVIKVNLPDIGGPYLKGFWPRDGAVDVSRDTNIMFFINDDESGVDIRTLKMSIANVDYKINTINVMTITYTGANTDIVQLNIQDYNLSITVNGVIVTLINFTHYDYETIKKVSLHINSLLNFESTMIDKNYDQIPSIDLAPVYSVPINMSTTLAVAKFEDNINVSFMPRSNGYLVAVTPNETFENNFIVKVSIDAADFLGKVMPTEKYFFTCKDIVTPPRSIQNEWYQKHTNIVNRIRENLESTYNKNTDSTIFHTYFKNLALEISKSMQLTEDYRDNLYFRDSKNTIRPELLYQNLGYLLKTGPREEFSHGRYKEILLTLMQMFFKGSTKDSLLEGLAIFLDVKSISISEDYLNDRSTLSIKEHTDKIEQQFMFSLDVDIGNEPLKNWDDFNESIQTALTLVKPAHTFFLVRYLFSEVVRTKDIVDEIAKWHFTYYGYEDVRTNCADKYKIAEIITEDISNQFNGTNNCCTAFYKPILSWDESTITSDPADITLQVWRDINTFTDEFDNFNTAYWNGYATVSDGYLKDTNNNYVSIYQHLAKPSVFDPVEVEMTITFKFQQNTDYATDIPIFLVGSENSNHILIKWQQFNSPQEIQHKHAVIIDGVINSLNITNFGSNILFINENHDVQTDLLLNIRFFENRVFILINNVLVCDGYYSLSQNFNNYNLRTFDAGAFSYSWIDTFKISGKFFSDTIDIISVDGFSGKICLSRNPLPDETVQIIYKFNKFVIYRELGFYLNTYTQTAGSFDLIQPYLLNQMGLSKTIIIDYLTPEQMHAHACETGIFIDVHYGIMHEDKYELQSEQINQYINDFEQEDVDLDIREKFSIATNVNEQADFNIKECFANVKTNISEFVNIFEKQIDSAIAVETVGPNVIFLTNTATSITNSSIDLLFFWIEREFGGF